jgi:hypothetical protein
MRQAVAPQEFMAALARIMAMTANYSDTNTLRRRNPVTAKVRELVPVEMNLFGGTGTERTKRT